VHTVKIGLRNILMDSHAGVTVEKFGDDYVNESRKVAETKLTALYAGEVRTAGTRTSDPVKAEAMKIATGKVKTAAKKAGESYDAKQIRAMAESLVAKVPAITELAKKNVAENRALEVEVDLAELV
jgi:hypothetical protein